MVRIMSRVQSSRGVFGAGRPEALEAFLNLAGDVSGDKPVVMSKFIDGAREIEMDGVADGGKVVAALLVDGVQLLGSCCPDLLELLDAHCHRAYAASGVTLFLFLEASADRLAQLLGVDGCSCCFAINESTVKSQMVAWLDRFG